MKFIHKILGFSMLVLGILIISTQSAYAIGVKPLRTELTIDPGSSKTATITIINSDEKSITAVPEIDVYVKSDKEGFPIPEKLADDDTRNIKSWISLNNQEVNLDSNENKDVTFTITVPEGAEPGGRYASIIYAPKIEKGAKGVQIRARVASLILITVTGEEIKEGSLVKFGLKDDKILSDQPIKFDVSFANSGNVHLKPKGEITLKTSTGTVLRSIAKYTDPTTGREMIEDAIPVNLNNGNVLPKSPRTFDPDWNENPQIGKFIASLTLNYAPDKPEITQDFEFEIREDLQATDFAFRETGDGSEFLITATNNGNIHEKLVGSIKIKNAYSSTVAEIEIPDDSPYIAPGETATITVPWIVNIPEGKLKAELTFSHGISNTEVNMSVSFGKGSNIVMILIYVIIGMIVLIILGVIAFIVLRKKKSTPATPVAEQVATPVQPASPAPQTQPVSESPAPTPAPAPSPETQPVSESPAPAPAPAPSPETQPVSESPAPAPQPEPSPQTDTPPEPKQ